MNNVEDLVLFTKYNTLNQTVIYNFHQNPKPACFLQIYQGKYFRNSFQIYVSGKGLKPENEGYITIGVKILDEKVNNDIPHILSYDSIINIVDAERIKRFPRTFQFQFDLRKFQSPGYYLEERYFDRRIISNDPSNILHQNALVVRSQATVSEWVFSEPRYKTTLPPMMDFDGFEEKQFETGIETYLLGDSVHANFLRKESRYFQTVWEIPMLEKFKKSVFIPNEDLIGFLDMLTFIEHDVIPLNVTIFELYRIADKYDIERLLKTCRSLLTAMLSKKNVSEISAFAHSYNDTELQTAVTSYIQNLEMAESDKQYETEESVRSKRKPETYGKELKYQQDTKEVSQNIDTLPDIAYRIPSLNKQILLTYKKPKPEYFDFYH